MIFTRFKREFASFKIIASIVMVVQLVIVFSISPAVAAKEQALSKIRLVLVPNDLGYQYQTDYLTKIKAPQVWDKVQSLNLRPVIAVLDSGVDIDNPDLQANIWFNSWEVPGDKLDNDSNGY
ncbi:MAG: hypothetical protein Q8P40_07715, partial [Nitrospirota bacterium]|nr:hypothetical protein [Nitrospirota bacterium]